MKIIKCAYCGKLVKTNATTSIRCCSVQQPITDQNWLNKPAQNPETPINQDHTQDVTSNNTSVKSEEDTAGMQTESEVQKGEENNAIDKPIIDDKPTQEDAELENSAPQEFEVEKEIIDPEPSKEEINLDDWDFLCSNCKEVFNKEGNTGTDHLGQEFATCPDCGQSFKIE